MPNPIYLQQRQDPWEALLPQLLGNLFLAKVKHGWDMEMAAAESEAKAEAFISQSEAKDKTYIKQLGLQKQKELEVKREGAAFQRKTRYVTKGGQLYAQDYDYNPQTRQEIPSGDMYPSKQPGGAEIKISSGGEREKLAAGLASLDLLDNLHDLFKEAYVGPVAGRVGKVKDIFGGNPLKQSEFNAATATLKNQVIKEITGAQMSEPEAKRIMKQIPDVTDPPSVWQAKWNQTRKNLFNVRKRRLEVMERSGIKIPEEPIGKTFKNNDPLGLRD